MRLLVIELENCVIDRYYAVDDPIWNLPEDKQIRKGIADTQRELTIEADRLVQIKQTVRG